LSRLPDSIPEVVRASTWTAHRGVASPFARPDTPCDYLRACGVACRALRQGNWRAMCMESSRLVASRSAGRPKGRRPASSQACWQDALSRKRVNRWNSGSRSRSRAESSGSVGYPVSRGKIPKELKLWRWDTGDSGGGTCDREGQERRRARGLPARIRGPGRRLGTADSWHPNSRSGRRLLAPFQAPHGRLPAVS
jgi:hypothetical protein